MTRRANGFTLLELVLVLVIIGVLSSSALFGLSGVARQTDTEKTEIAAQTWLQARMLQAVYANAELRIHQTNSELTASWADNPTHPVIAVHRLSKPLPPQFMDDHTSAAAELAWIVLPTGQVFGVEPL